MKKIILISLFLFLMLFDAFSYADAIQSEISQNVIRLHIIASSDKPEDQTLKLKVRDSVLKQMREQDFSDYSIAYNYISNNLDTFKEIALSTLKENGCNDDVHIEFKKCDFPEKSYDLLTFPSGEYIALRIIIGEGVGHNWWCVMFPALCFSDFVCSGDNAEIALKEALSEESFAIIANKSKIKLKIVDFFN